MDRSHRVALPHPPPPVAPAPGERVELVFAGLDTVAQVRLDDHLLGTPSNMHRTHRYDVTDLLGDEGAATARVPGGHDLVVDLTAPLDAAEAMSQAQGPRVHTNEHPFNAVRKMACNFGWDWGPDLVTAGIWRPVLVERWHTARLGSVRPLATVDGTTGRVEVHVEVARPAGEGATLSLAASLTAPDGTPYLASVVVGSTGSDVVVALDVPQVALWWPRGYGDQPLYDLVVSLSSLSSLDTPDTPDTPDTLDPEGHELDRWQGRTGFRTVTLDTEPDEHGTPFVLSVNHHPVLVKGANWIPDDAFPHRVDHARYATRIVDAVEAGMNLLRVWGGGIYESDDFYDLCDEQGVLVWQDFLFACAAYAEEPPLRGEVVAEATEAVTRLSPHPSLVVWNGNNENLWGHEDWGWAAQLGDLTWGRGYYLEVLPELLARLDPTRPYSPGSPWSFDEQRHPNDPAHGTTHLWDVWNTLDHTHYRDSVPRFVSEFGYQGPPTWATLTQAVHDRPLTPTSPAMSSHQKAIGGDDKLNRGIAPHLHRPPDDRFDDWHWAMQVQQARAVRFGLEHLRSWHPVCSGAIVWQLNDCWPVTSWAAVDGDGGASRCGSRCATPTPRGCSASSPARVGWGSRSATTPTRPGSRTSPYAASTSTVTNVPSRPSPSRSRRGPRSPCPSRWRCGATSTRRATCWSRRQGSSAPCGSSPRTRISPSRRGGPRRGRSGCPEATTCT